MLLSSVWLLCISLRCNCHHAAEVCCVSQPCLVFYPGLPELGPPICTVAPRIWSGRQLLRRHLACRDMRAITTWSRTSKSQTYAWKTLFTYWTPVSAIGRLFRSEQSFSPLCFWLACSIWWLPVVRPHPALRPHAPIKITHASASWDVGYKVRWGESGVSWHKFFTTVVIPSRWRIGSGRRNWMSFVQFLGSRGIAYFGIV